MMSEKVQYETEVINQIIQALDAPVALMTTQRAQMIQLLQQGGQVVQGEESDCLEEEAEALRQSEPLVNPID